MIKISNSGPRSNDVSADSYVENGSKDVLRTTSSVFDEDETTGLSDSTTTTSDTYVSGAEDPRTRTNSKGGVVVNGPNSKYNQISQTTSKNINPITGNMTDHRTSLGRKGTSIPGISRREFGKLSSSLWTAFLCGTSETLLYEKNRKDLMNVLSLWLRSTNCSAENLIDFLKVEGGRIGLDKSVLKERLSGTMIVALNTLHKESREVLLKSLADQASQSPNTLEASINGVTSAVNGEPGDVTRLSQLLNSVPGANDVITIFDLQAEVAVLGSVLDKAIELGIPQAALALMQKVEDDRVRQKILLSKVMAAARRSDLDFIEMTLDMTSAARIRAEAPELIPTLFQWYALPTKTGTDEYPAIRTRIVTLANNIDPDWDTVSRDGEEIRDLGPFISASDDLNKLMANGEYAVESNVAQEYKKIHIHSSARQFYPFAVLDYAV